MTDAKHTPGPWRLEEGDKLSAISCGDADEYQSIAFLTLPNHQANARLIAAAPDLLEALKMMLADPDAIENVSFASAVIAKAKCGAE